MPVRDLEAPLRGVATLIRNEPVQARSTARLTALLDATAAVIEEIGFERLTTAMVAERAGASIGTVYRYFPDRLAVLQALALRNYDRVLERVRTTIEDPARTTWVDAMEGVFDVVVDAFRTEPGFRSLRVGDVIDLHPRPTPDTSNSLLAREVLDLLSTRFDLPRSAEITFAFECAIEITDALVARAFAGHASGDERFLEQGRSSMRRLLGDRLPPVG